MPELCLTTPPRRAIYAAIVFLLSASLITAANYRPMSIEEAARRASDGSALHERQEVILRGTVVADSDSFSRTYFLTFVTDGHAGIALFSRSAKTPSVRAGNVVEVAGRIRTYFGAVQVDVAQLRVVGEKKLGRPLEVEPDELRSYDLAGRLVQVEGVVRDISESSGLKLTLVKSEQERTSVYITESQRPAFANTSLRLGDYVRVTGVATQHDAVPPYRSGWQVRPRHAGDVVLLPRPPISRMHLVGGALVLAGVTFASGVWIVVLRRRVRIATASLVGTISILKAQQEATLDGIMVTSAEGVVNEANERFHAMWGIAPERLSGASVDEIIELQATASSDAQAFKKEMARLREANPERSSAAELRLSDGRIIIVNATSFVLPGGGSGGRVWNFRDITDREVMRSEVERSHRIESLGMLAASMCHEFNNVLMGIQPQAELIRRRADSDFVARASERIIASVERGRRTTTDVLQFSRSIDLQVRNVSVASLMHDVAAELRAVLLPSIRVEMSTVDSTLAAVVDADQITRVFVNLAVNAQHAMVNGGVLRLKAARNDRASYRFGSVPAGRELIHFTVQDTGSGIPEHLLKAVFEPLFTTKKGRGSGLGLAIVQQIVGAHGGYVFVESSLGISTTFHIFLPAADHVESHVSPTPATLPNLDRVLIVEDDVAVAEGLSMLLSAEGTKVMCVESGEEAIPAIEGFEPELVILDLDLPGIGGEEVYAEIARRWSALPVLFSTGRGGKERLAHNSGRTRFLPKPYDAAALFTAIRRLVDCPPGADTHLAPLNAARWNGDAARDSW